MRMLPKIEAVFELAEIFRHVLLGNPNVSTVDAALEPRPEAFNRVCMDRAAHVLAGAVIDRPVTEAIEGQVSAYILQGDIIGRGPPGTHGEQIWEN